MCQYVGPINGNSEDGWMDGWLTLTGHLAPPAVYKFKYWVNKLNKKVCGLNYFAALLKVSCL